MAQAFVRDHLLPMAAAIWSTPAAEVGAYPAAAFIRFCDNHGLLKLTTGRSGARSGGGRAICRSPDAQACRATSAWARQ